LVAAAARDLLELAQRARQAQAAATVPHGYALHIAHAELPDLTNLTFGWD
jgi:hypothetical protein